MKSGYLLLLLTLGACAHHAPSAPASRSSDCSFYQRAAERMRQPDGLAANVDPQIAHAWLAREAAQAGCSLSR
jgi:hypothetical protein